MRDTRLHELLQAGLAAQAQNNQVQAEEFYDLALQEFPESTNALNLLGSLYAEQRNYDDALPLLQKAVTLQPQQPIFNANLGNLLRQMGETESALPFLRAAVNLQPDYPEAICNLGQAYEELHKIDEARRCYQRAIRADGTYIRALLLLGALETEAGDEEASLAAFRRVLILAPGDTRAISGIMLSSKVTPNLPELAVLEKLLAGSLQQGRQHRLLFAAGKAYNDLGRYDEAMRHLHLAKESSGRSFDLVAFRAYVDALISLFTTEFLSARAGQGVASDRPVFIIGMPRSGTSLTEQILSSHAKVFGAGELIDISRIARRLDLLFEPFEPALNYGEALRAASPETLRDLAESYLKRLNFLNRTARRTVDKMPHNFQQVGLIALLFPNARIIHCLRDPVDTCLSIYMQNFNDTHNYAIDLKTLGLYYREYRRLMAHWATVLPNRIIEVQYEAIVEDVEAEARRMVSAVDLKWDPACLNYHMTKRVVHTASRWQVRQPIYKTSVGRWKRYGESITPLVEALGDLVSI